VVSLSADISVILVVGGDFKAHERFDEAFDGEANEVEGTECSLMMPAVHGERKTRVVVGAVC
jgi:hypothetical protein